MELNQNFAELGDEELTSYAAEVRAAVEPLIGLDAPTDEQLAEAESYADHLDAIAAEQQSRTEAAEARTQRAAALRERFSETPGETPPGEPEGDEDEDEDEDEGEEGGEGDEPPNPAPKSTGATKGVVALAKKVKRPPTPKRAASFISITAAADVPQFATGSKIEGLEDVGKALVNRMRGFSTPTGTDNGEHPQWQHYGVASFALDFPDDLIIDRGSDDMQVIAHAADESRLDGRSLTAAGGWCAPSETVYDLCANETAEGLVSVPEIQVRRGGINYTSGPSFDDIYNDTGFTQTEAQAIAGTAKPCYELECPTFEEVRLDVVGLCIRVPILTNAAYPELTQRVLSGSMIAHQHKVSASVINRMVTAAGAARVITGLGSTAHDTLSGLELIADQARQKYRLGMNTTLEVIVPFWVRGAVRSDLSVRSGHGSAAAITDQQVAAHFAARKLNVQFVYNFQPLDTTAEDYPATFNALMYPAGTFIKGTSDVINLNAVYDAASLATNVYTGLFFEEGLLVAQNCYDASLVTLPICNAGRTGANDLTCGAGA